MARDGLGTTAALLENGNSFNVKDYQYVLDNGKVGMDFIPVDEPKTICTVMDHTELGPKK